MIDFGFVIEHGREESAILHTLNRAMTTGRREDLVAAIRDWSLIADDPADSDRLRAHVAFADWCWRPFYHGGPFDFGDEAEFRRGIDLVSEMAVKRYSRARPTTLAITRYNFGVRSMLYRLNARIDVRPIFEEEVKASGWDRSDYA